MIKIKEYILSNKQKVALTALGVAAVGGFLYWLTRKPTKQPKIQQNTVQINNCNTSITSTVDNHQQQQQQQQPTQTKYNKLLTQSITKICKIFLQTNNQITPEAITAIIQSQYSLARQQIKSTIFKSRKQRRTKLDDLLQYANIITKHQLELQQLQEKYLGVILARFNIDKVAWKDACQVWEFKCQGQDQGISELIRKQEEKQLLSLLPSNTKPKDITIIKQILQQKLKYLQQLNPQQLGVNLGTDQAARYDMIQTYINDLIFKQYNMQPEDLQFSIQHLSKQDKKIVIQYEDQIVDKMNMLIQVQEQEEQENDKQAEVFA